MEISVFKYFNQLYKNSFFDIIHCQHILKFYANWKRKFYYNQVNNLFIRKSIHITTNTNDENDTKRQLRLAY